MRPVIALDADGVLLDYHAAYATAWQRAFGTLPRLKNPNAYWPLDRWHVDELSGERKDKFRAVFDDEHWSNVPALPDALEACTLLVDAGFELVCVTAVRNEFADARKRNIDALGLPIQQVIATGKSQRSGSPKAPIIEDLAPAAFVDDYLPYFKGVPSYVHRALVLREPDGSPNVGSDLQLVDSTHVNLIAFAKWWLARRDEDGPRAS